MKIAVRTPRALLLLAGAVASALLIGFVVLLLWPLPDMPADGLQGDFLIQNVGVVDVRYGRLLLEGLFLTASSTIGAHWIACSILQRTGPAASIPMFISSGR